MSLSAVQIWQSMQEGEIASAADCRQWASEVLASAGSAALENPQILLSQLVKLGHLTPFQANALLSNDMQTLTIGRHRLLAPLASAALSNWFEAIDPSSNAARWLFAISKEQLKKPAIDRHPPSLRLARMHAAIQARGLQNFSPPAFIDGYLLIAATPADGQPLRDALKSYPRRAMPTELAVKMVCRIATALAALHREGIVHGRVGIDQVWWDGEEEVTLLRDPFFPPMTPLGLDTPTAVGIESDHDFRVRYAAPEFTAPGQSPTLATDVYALGCLWWELMTGQLPYADMMLDRVPTAACNFPLVMAKEQEITPGQRRCLDYMLAKNPTNRFPDAGQVAAALEVIDPKVAASLREASSKTIEAPDQLPSQLPSQPPSQPPSPSTVKTTSESLQAPLPTVAPSPLQAPAASKSQAPAASLSPAQPTTPIALNSSKLPVPPAASQPSPKTQVLNQPKPKATEKQSMPAVVQEPIEKKTETPPSPAKAKSTTKAGQSQTGARRVGKKKSRPAWLLPSMLGGCVLLLSGLVGILTWNKDTSIPQKEVTKVEEKQVATNTVPSLPTESQSTDSTTKTTKTRSVDPLDDQFMISKSDETLPWVPPRSSQPYSLSMLPPGAQGFIFIRPQAWLTTQGGQAIAQALDDSIGKFWKPIEKASGTPLESIVEIAIGLYPGKADGWPVLAYRIQLSEETSIANLKERLTNATEQSVNNKHSVLMNGDQAIFLGTAQQINDEARQFMAVGPAALIRELAEMDGDGAPLRRQMEQLWQSSDANSDLTLLLTTGFFFSDARNVLPSISPRVSTLCKELLDEKTQAILISTTLEPQWYGELRIMGKDGDDATRFVQVTRDRMKLVADAMESDLVANPASLYWRAIASRYPQMLRALTRYIRFGVENGQAISNFYLPSAASANMTIASWMAVQTQSNSPSGPVKVAQEVPTNELKGDDLLGHPVSINFEQEPLDSALALLTEEINRSLPKGTGPIALSIDGKSFELASVTRNQQIRDFRFKEQPLRVLLTDITARINPDRTVKSLDEAKQAVVWVLTEADGKSNVLFTTRRGIEGTDRKLPIEYQAATKP